MGIKRDPNELSVEELEQLLYQKKRSQRRGRLARMKAGGRLIEVAGLPPPNPAPPPLPRPKATPTEALQRYQLETVPQNGNGSSHDLELPEDEEGTDAPRPPIQWRWVFNKMLLVLEVSAVLGLFVLGFYVWGTARELNQEIATVQESQVASIALPTPTATPVIEAIILPSGHKPPIDGRPAEPGEAGYVPEHLLPLIDSYVPPPIPTPGPEQARRIEIPAIDVDAPIFQGDDWDQLKKGVGQHIGSALPGQNGNVVLSAHNDIFGQLFRYLDKLSPGDEIIISTERQTYTYVVRDIDTYDPTEVWVMAPTEHASATLISCYPYLVNNKRIVVFADLATTTSNS
ncbi:MAG: class D sortase [Candidatus Promineifilaceae bacterium]